MVDNSVYNTALHNSINGMHMILGSKNRDKNDKQACVACFAGYLRANVFGTLTLESSDVICATDSMVRTDKRISTLHAARLIDQQQYDEGICLCSIQEENISILSSKGKEIPKVVFSDFKDVKKWLAEKHLLFSAVEQNSAIQKMLFSLRSMKSVAFRSAYSQISIYESLLEKLKEKGLLDKSLLQTDINAMRAEVRSLEMQNDERKQRSTLKHDLSELDERLSIVFSSLSSNYDADYSEVFAMIDQYESLLSVCKNKGIRIGKLKNENVVQARQRVGALKKRADYLKRIREEIIQNDNELYRFLPTCHEKMELVATLLGIAQRQIPLVENYTSLSKTPLSLRCNDLPALVLKLTTYNSIFSVDYQLVQLSEKTSLNNLKKLGSLCNQQIRALNYCSHNGWDVPKTQITDFLSLKKKVRDAEKKSNRRIFFVVLASIIVLIILCTIGLGHKGKTNPTILSKSAEHQEVTRLLLLPYSYNEMVGMNYSDLCQKIGEAGFKSISSKSSNEGIFPPLSVIRVEVNGKKAEDETYSSEDNIVVTYASDDRIDLSGELNEWDKKTFPQIQQNLNAKGFQVKIAEVDSDDPEKNSYIKTITINGEKYQSGYCFAPKRCEIILYIYANVIRVDSSNSVFIGVDYRVVREQLIEKGFTNIVLVRDDDLTGESWINDSLMDATVASIAIDGKSEFSKDALFKSSAQIVVHVHTRKDTQYEFIAN